MQCVYIIISLISLASIAWVSFSIPKIVWEYLHCYFSYCRVSFAIPMLACDAPLWSGCLSLLPGIVFDTHIGVECLLNYACVSHFRRVLFSIPITLSLLLSITQVSFSIPMRARESSFVVWRSAPSFCRVSFSLPMHKTSELQ